MNFLMNTRSHYCKSRIKEYTVSPKSEDQLQSEDHGCVASVSRQFVGMGLNNSRLDQSTMGCNHTGYLQPTEHRSRRGGQGSPSIYKESEPLYAGRHGLHYPPLRNTSRESELEGLYDTFPSTRHSHSHVSDRRRHRSHSGSVSASEH